MRQITPMLSTRVVTLILAVSVVAAPSLLGADNTSRFSQALSVAERAEAGIKRLTSDEAAVLDALVRRDLASRTSTRAEEESTLAPFSERLTADERRLAGFERLTAAESARVNALIERHATARLARTLLAPPTYVPRMSRVEPVENADRKKIHGTFSLSYGWGKGGYSERSGAMMLNYDDPDGRYSITIGYRETHVKGPEGHGVYLDGPPFGPYYGPE